MRVFSKAPVSESQSHPVTIWAHMRGLVYVVKKETKKKNVENLAALPQVGGAVEAEENSTPSFKFICANLLSHSIKSNPINKHLK